MTDSVQHWAMIERDRKKAIREAIEGVLKAHSISETAFNQLHDEALSELMATHTDRVDSDEWTVQVIPDKPITYKQATIKDGVVKEPFKQKLRLSLKER